MNFYGYNNDILQDHDTNPFFSTFDQKYYVFDPFVAEWWVHVVKPLPIVTSSQICHISLYQEYSVEYFAYFISAIILIQEKS